MSMADKWNDFRPSKAALFWTAVGAIALTLIVGFTWGGWVTGGTAEEMAEEAAEQARAQLVATICVERFTQADDAQAKLASLKDTSTWQREDFIAEGGWIKLPGVEEPVDEAAELCAERLVEMELPQKAAEATETSVQ